MSQPAPDKTVSTIAEAWAVAGDKPLAVDREKGIVTGIRIVNRRSKNFRKYPDPVTAAAAAKYNAPSNLGHHRDPATGRPLEVPPDKRFGRTFDARPDPVGGGITASYRFNTAHPFAAQFAWVCENDPGQLSFSPLHRVKWANGGQPDADGDMVAEAILEVFSVDLVSDGGTTTSVFESFDPAAQPTPASKPVALDPKAIAAQIGTPAQLEAFLTDLFGQLDQMDPTLKAGVLESLVRNMPGMPDPDASEESAGESVNYLRRFGRVGKWAAERIDRQMVADRQAKARKWADDLIAAEGLAPALKTDTFVELVAESMGNADRAKKLIADRKGLAVGGPRTVPSGGADGHKRTVQDVVAGMVAGK